MTSWNKGKGKAIAWLRDHVTHTGRNCLIWPFCTDRDGYGFFGHDGKNYKAHRWMCEAIHGPAPSPAHHAGHDCGNGHRGCISPDHIIWKTPIENARDRIKHGTTRTDKGRKARKLTVEQVREIIALKGQKSHVELAAIYNVTDSNIRKIQQGISWRGGRAHKPGFAPGDPRNRRRKFVNAAPSA